MAQIIPIDPRTGQPRQGHWQGRYWIPANPEPVKIESTNPNNDGTYGRTFYGKKVKK